MTGNEFSKTVFRVANGNSFIEGHLDASIIMVGKNVDETHKFDLFSFLKPFHWQVWLPTETIYFAALSFNGDIKFQPSTDYARVFVLLLAFWGLILSSAYTANLASFLVIQNSPTLQVETVGEAVAANLPLCVVEGTFPETEVLKTYPEARLVTVPTTSPNEIFTNVLNGRCQLAITPIYVCDNVKGNRTINSDCKLKWVGRTFKFVRSGFSTRSDSGTLCTNLIRDVLSLHIGEMVDDGSLDAIYRQYHRSIHTIDCNRGTDTFLASEEEENTKDDIEGDGSLPSSLDNDSQSVQPLSLQDLGGLFIVIYCVGFLSCIAAFLSWYSEKRKKRVQIAQKTIVENDLILEESPCE
ncbi:ligand-gated ion channel [Nitzschia inconspicua]|uniref:Ligand-gated ion channel n=1 Tax=Nitzschia inconspicua TaxID=303405 RepID=A0A9K3M6E5_9STRA|nr:ligand-gated ion channel [Nitzschia inconspicua]